MFFNADQTVKTKCHFFRYSKKENLTFDDPEIMKFTHLLIEARSKYSPNIKPYLKTHDILDSVDGFSHIAINYNTIPPIRIKTKPVVFVMKRKSDIPFHRVIKEEPDEPVAGSVNEDTPDFLYDSLRSKERMIDDLMRSIENPDSEPISPETDYLPIQSTLPPDEVNANEPNVIEFSMESRSMYEDNFDDDECDDVKSNDDEILAQGQSVSETEPTENNNSYETDDKDKDNDGDEISAPDESDSKTESKKLKFSNEIDDNTDNNDEDVKSTDNKEFENEISEDISNFEGSTPIAEKRRPKESIKESVKKLIQEKMEEIRSKRSEASIGSKTKKDIPVTKRASGESTETVTPRRKTNDNSREKNSNVRVRESIRNLISQFNELEKDFEKDQTESKGSTEVGAIASDEVDAKESLKEIIGQFKHLMEELTSEEDKVINDIEKSYKEKPIAETLMQFSEALKKLVQRRKTNGNENDNVSERKRKLRSKMTVNDVHLSRETSDTSDGERDRTPRENDEL